MSIANDLVYDSSDSYKSSLARPRHRPCPYLVIPIRTQLEHPTLSKSNMPSLRRTRSAPASRRTQYSHSCPASSTSHTPATRAGSRPPRRPSGSQTSERRVLADLDLWRVEASQREVRGLSSWEPLRASSPTSSEEDELDQEELVPSGSSRSPSPTPSSPITTHNILGGSFSSSWDSLPGAGLSFLEDSSSLHLSFALASPAIPEPLEVSFQRAYVIQP